MFPEELTVAQLLKKYSISLFMEPKDSFLCLQEHANGPYSEPDISGSNFHTLFVEHRFKYYHPIHTSAKLRFID
jgi:hypothetical protein